MPDYDYRCKDCLKTFTLHYASIADMEAASSVCPHCESRTLSRLIRQVSLMTPEGTRLSRLSDPSVLAGIDDEDPRQVGRLMRNMANELGEDAGPEIHEIADRLSAGQSPEQIEKSMTPPAPTGLD